MLKISDIILHMDYIITPYSPSDQQPVRKLILDSLAVYGFSFNQDLDGDLDDPQKFYMENGGMFYVLKVGDKVVGTVAVIDKNNALCELKRLYVKKKYQGQGFGSALLGTAITFAKKKGFKKIEFETNKNFVKAHVLYQKNGFITVREDKNSYYMEKEL